MELWLPRTARDAEQRTGFCRICKTSLLPSEAARHVASCFKRNEGDVRMLSPKLRAPGITGDEGVDLEFEDYHRKRGAWRR